MRHPLFQSIIAWVCLVAVVVNATIATGALVVCDDGTGITRIEWGCERNTAGQCESACCFTPYVGASDQVVGPSDPGLDAVRTALTASDGGAFDLAQTNVPTAPPCKDTPLERDASGIQAPTVRVTLDVAIGAFMPIAVESVRVHEAWTDRVRWEWVRAARPPDTWRDVRCIILIV
ncbi:hypothetical protein J4558_12560 [Leptolyngbya sp. 15MV]|nr:hypothetical protein J4558_12560 [Leptolyngbya sp. 15MV]